MTNLMIWFVVLIDELILPPSHRSEHRVNEFSHWWLDNRVTNVFTLLTWRVVTIDTIKEIKASTVKSWSSDGNLLSYNLHFFVRRISIYLITAEGKSTCIYHRFTQSVIVVRYTMLQREYSLAKVWHRITGCVWKLNWRVESLRNASSQITRYKVSVCQRESYKLLKTVHFADSW